MTDDISLFVLAVREHLLAVIQNSVPARFTVGLVTRRGICMLGNLPLLVRSVNSLQTGIVFYARVWQTSEQLSQALPVVTAFVEKYLPETSIQMDYAECISTPRGLTLYYRDSAMTNEAERKAFSEFVDTGCQKENQLFYTTKHGCLMQSDRRDDRANLCEITDSKIIAGKHRAKHLTDLLEAYARKRNIPLVWKASVRRVCGEKILFKYWPDNKRRDDAELIRESIGFVDQNSNTLTEDNLQSEVNRLVQRSGLAGGTTYAVWFNNQWEIQRRDT